jgi:hypothetical protein
MAIGIADVLVTILSPRKTRYCAGGPRDDRLNQVCARAARRDIRKLRPLSRKNPRSAIEFRAFSAA